MPPQAELSITTDEFDWLHEQYLKAPEDFVTEVLGAAPWAKQVEIIRSTFEYKYTAVKTCNAIGKSFIAARIVVTYLMNYPGSIVVTTAPTWRQVTDVLWREIATTVKQSRYKLTTKEVTQAGLNLDTDWYAVGLSTKRPENFFGYHSDHILVVVDEAGGVEEPIFKGVAAITPNANARVLLIGNPTTPSGAFYDAFNKAELGYNCITVSAFDSPNFIDTNIRNIDDLLRIFTAPQQFKQADWIKAVNERLEKMMNPTYIGLISPSVVFSRYHEWGADSSAWQSLIMGEFPSQADQALIPTNLVTMAMNMYGVDKDTNKTYAELSGWKIPDGPPIYGQDMARFGNDSNVLTPRHGGWVEKQVIWNKVDLMESADRIEKLIETMNPLATINIDDTGNGGGTTDRLRQKKRAPLAQGQPELQYKINAYNFSSKEFMEDSDKAKFFDITSMMYWNLRSHFFRKAIALHFDQQLFDELVGRRWSIEPGGKIKVESKEDYKKRTGGKSPDRSDSLALAFAKREVGTWQETVTEQKSAAPTRRETEKEQSRKPITRGMLDTRY